MEEEIKSEYVKIGSVGVDSATLMIADPCYVKDNDWAQKDYDKYVVGGMEKGELSKEVPFVDDGKNVKDLPFSKALLFSTDGDGIFDVFAKIEQDDIGKRITEIRIKLR